MYRTIINKQIWWNHLHSSLPAVKIILKRLYWGALVSFLLLPSYPTPSVPILKTPPPPHPPPIHSALQLGSAKQAFLYRFITLCFHFSVWPLCLSHFKLCSRLFIFNYYFYSFYFYFIFFLGGGGGRSTQEEITRLNGFWSTETLTTQNKYVIGQFNLWKLAVTSCFVISHISSSLACRGDLLLDWRVTHTRETITDLQTRGSYIVEDHHV